MLADSEVLRSPPSPRRRQGRGALEAVEELLGAGGLQVGQRQAHAQRVAIEPLHAGRRTPRSPARARRPGRGPAAVPAYSVASSRCRPPSSMRRIPGPSQASAVRLVMITALFPPRATARQKSRMPAAARPASSGGVARPGSGISQTDSKLSQISSSRRSRSSSQQTAAGAARRPCGRRSRARTAASPMRVDHPVQAEGGHPGLEGVPEHPLRLLDPAGVAPPAAEGLGQLGLAGPAGPVHHHHPLQPQRRLQRVEQRRPGRRTARPAPAPAPAPAPPRRAAGSGPAAASSDGAPGPGGRAQLRERDSRRR